MNYQLIIEVIELVQKYENETSETTDIEGFKNWISKNNTTPLSINWESKANGRSPESVISTLLVHMNRYAKLYSKSAILNSEFSSQEDFIYLITLHTFGQMTKMDLIKKNVHDKPAGIQIINRLIQQGWIIQNDSQSDKRSKLLCISEFGIETLQKHMHKIRQASKIVAGDLSENEKMELIKLLTKLSNFHHSIYVTNYKTDILLEAALNKISKN